MAEWNGYRLRMMPKDEPCSRILAWSGVPHKMRKCLLYCYPVSMLAIVRNRMNVMIDFTNNDRRFRYRAAGVAIEEDHVLLHRTEDADFWILPGGRVEFGETSVDALKREMKEELGQTIQVGRLLWIAESFLVDAGQRVHGIGLYYAMQLPGNPANRASFEIMDGRFRLLFAWHPLTDLPGLTVYPPFLREGLVSLPDHPTHILDVRAETGS